MITLPCLTVWPEWAPCFTVADKRIENRGWPPPAKYIGQRFALHAGASLGGGSAVRGLDAMIAAAGAAGWNVWANSSIFAFAPAPTGMFRRVAIPYRRVFATATLAGATHDDDDDLTPADWAMPGCWHWRFDDLEVVTGSEPVRGRQGIWKVTL